MSGPAGFLCFDGQLLADPCRMATYIANGLACDKWRCPPWFDFKEMHCIEGSCWCHQLTDDDGEPFCYSAPDTVVNTTVFGVPEYEACWVTEDPTSAQFLGVTICERQISQSLKRKVQSTGCGGIIGLADRGPIEITFSAWIVAGTLEGTQFGYRWLADQLGLGPFATGGCADGTLTIADHCGTDDDSGFRTLNRVAVVSDLEDITPAGFSKCCGMKVQWTMVAESPWIFGDKQFCLEGFNFAANDCSFVNCPTVPCPVGPESGCSPNCSVETTMESTTIERPRTDCNLLVYPNGESCPQIPLEDYAECTWVPVATAYENELATGPTPCVLLVYPNGETCPQTALEDYSDCCWSAIAQDYPDDTTTESGDLIININNGEDEECVDCPVQLVWDGTDLTWEPLPGFDSWYTPGQPIDYAACCPKVLRICRPNEAISPILCATTEGFAIAGGNIIDIAAFNGAETISSYGGGLDGDGIPTGLTPNSNFNGADTTSSTLQALDRYLDCASAGDLSIPTSADIGSQPSGFFERSRILFNTSTGCYEVWTIRLEPPGPGQGFEVSSVTQHDTGELLCPGLTFVAQLYEDPPSGPVCCTLEINANGTVDTPGITDFGAVLDGGQCTFEIDCPTEEDPTTPNVVNCAKVVHILMNDPSDPHSDSTIVSPVGAMIGVGDTVIIDNLPECPDPEEAALFKCPKIVHVTLNDPADPYSDTVIVSPAGGEICEGDTIIIDNNPEDPIEVISEYEVDRIVCDDPCHNGSIPPPPKAIYAPESCFCAPIVIARECKIIESAADGRVVGWEINAGSFDLRNLRIRFWPYRDGLPLYENAPETWECQEPCSTVEIPYLKVGCPAKYDPEMESIVSGFTVTGAGGGRYIPAAIPGGKKFYMCIEADGLNTASDVEITVWTQTASIPVTT